MLVIQLLLGKDKYSNFFKSFFLIIPRWSRDANGSIIRRRNNAIDRLKPALEFIAIQRQDTKEWALPGVRNLVPEKLYIVTIQEL
jgi:hypothetical protein